MTTTAEPSANLTSLKSRYESVQQRIAAAAAKSGRAADEIILVAVTKYAAIDDIRELVGLGHVDLGESQVQQLVQRSALMEEYMQRLHELRRDTGKGREVRWHMIGHLQRNKARKVIPLTRLIHSLDSLRLAEEIQAAATKQEQPVEVLIQINVTDEKTKHGIAPAAAAHMLDQIDTMMNIKPRGMMVMGPTPGPDGEVDLDAVRRAFTRAKELFDDLRKTATCGDRFDILSMGMTHDFELAIECGANIVRVGSAIFGPRNGDAGDATA